VTAHERRPAYEPAARLLAPTQYDPRMKRPVSTAAGAALVMLRVIAGVLWCVGIAQGRHNSFVDLIVPDGSADVEASYVPIVIGFVGVSMAVYAVLGVFIFFGFNWARVTVMVFSTLSIASSFIGWWSEGQEITLGSSTSVFAVAVDILILLALSSRSAAKYARRNEKHPD
jgi:hypothetical protein